MSQIQDIKDSLSIVEIIGEKVKLSPAGNYYKGLCPFHHEKSPSFFVNEQMNFYKCFGCGEHGDVFNFLQKYEGLTFKEALESLAKRAGIVLEQQNYDPNDKLRERLLEIMELSANYFQDNLKNSPECQLVRNYLQKRKINASTVNLFHLGAAKDQWSELTDMLIKKGYASDELVASGMTIRKETGRMYDRFRHRLIFPLKNHRGQIVGFSGRIMSDDKKEAKYLNSPETMIYHKGKMLYGFHELNQEIKKAGEILIVEGEFDMLSSVQAKVDNVAAIKGSALTIEHAKLISRFVKKVALALDADKAGIEATKKAIKTLRELNIELKIVMIDEGKDPDELAQKEPAVWREKVKGAVSVYEFFLRVILKKYNLDKIDEQKAAVQELAEVFALIDNKLEYEYYLKKLAQALKQKVNDVRHDLEKWQSLGKTPMREQKKPAKKKKITKMAMLEAYIWFLFLHCLDSDNSKIEAEDFIINAQWKNQTLKQLSDYYRNYQAKFTNRNLKSFKSYLPADYQEKIALLFLNKNFVDFLSKTELQSEWQKIMVELKKEKQKQQINQLQSRLSILDEIEELSAKEEEERREILIQVRQIQNQKI